MKNPPEIIIEALEPFAQHFSRDRTWKKARVLVIGTLLTNGRRVITGALRMMGLHQSQSYNQYHHVLSRAVWSPLAMAQTLLTLIITTFFNEDEPFVFGIDETIERRWRRKIKARGIYRDAVLSSGSNFVKASGLRWISIMLLTPISWAQRIWVLPIMTVLSPSQRYYEQLGRQPKTLLKRALQMLKQLKWWLPTQDIVVVGDGSYAAIDFLHDCQESDVTFITRLRWDAALYEPAPAYCGRGRPRKKGQRQPTLESRLHDAETDWVNCEIAWYGGTQRTVEMTTGTDVWFHYGKPAISIRWVIVRDPAGEVDPIALLCTDPQRDMQWIVACFVSRWQVEVTFEEVRRHLGVESQRQWSDKAIARTTPILMGLFSWVTLLAEQLNQSGHLIDTRQCAWYAKSLPTFSDALASVRKRLWHYHQTFLTSTCNHDMRKIPKHYFDTLIDAVSYVA